MTGVCPYEVQLSAPVLILQLEWPYSWVVNGEDFASDKSRYAAALRADVSLCWAQPTLPMAPFVQDVMPTCASPDTVQSQHACLYMLICNSMWEPRPYKADECVRCIALYCTT